MTRSKSEGRHRPVMADEVATLLVTGIDGTYIDLTAGSGGHLLKLSQVLTDQAVLIGVDRDPMAVARTQQNLTDIPQDHRIIQAPYDDLERISNELGIESYDGALLDLGLSSEQLDDPARGFAFRLDGPLDMRFDPNTATSAADLINNSSETELVAILKDFGQERKARKLAREIVKERQKQVITDTAALTTIISRVVRGDHLTKTLARVFQGLRIAVNSELTRLQRVLPLIADRLSPTGRIAVISYHSLEDRIVKWFFADQARDCVCPPRLPVCICDHRATLEIVTRRSIVPSESEIASNSRARSARLRVAQRRVA